MPIFYKIIAPNGNVNYLFGTMHVNDVDVVTLPIELIEIFDNASQYIFEVNLNDIENEPNLTEHLVKSWFARQEKNNFKSYKKNATQLINLHFPKNYKDFINSPIQLLVSIYTIILQKSITNHLDVRLQNRAKNKPIQKILYLESLEEQLTAGLGLNLTLQEQIKYFNACYDVYNTQNYKKYAKSIIESIKKAYLAQEVFIPHEPTSDAENHPYKKNVIDNRDTTMANRLCRKYQLQSLNNTFIAVGSAHLPGITQKLQKFGFIIEPITLNRRIIRIKTNGHLNQCDITINQINTIIQKTTPSLKLNSALDVAGIIISAIIGLVSGAIAGYQICGLPGAIVVSAIGAIVGVGGFYGIRFSMWAPEHQSKDNTKTLKNNNSHAFVT